MKRSLTKRRPDELLLFSWLLTMLLGMVMVYSSSSILAESRFGSQWFFLRQQFIWVLLSIGVVWIICRMDLRRLAVYSVPTLILTMLLLTIVFVMPARNGAHRWLMLGPLTVQPSEIFKFLVIMYLAFSLSNPRRNISQLQQLIFPYVPLIGLGLGLILFEPDLGTTLVIGITVLGLFFLAGVRIKHLLYTGMPLAATAAFAVFVLGYKRMRVMNYLEAVIDPLQGGYQAKQAALTLGAGGLMGSGLGDGRQKLFFLPYPHTDFIFASTGEELGFVGLIFLLSLFFFILVRGIKIAAAQPDRFGYLLAAGMTWSLFVNIAVNLAVVTSLLPVTGLALPFMSYGGSSLLISSASVGVLLNLSQRRLK